jgi:hypothetical protein
MGTLLKTTTFSYSRGKGYGSGETNSDNSGMKSHFYEVKYGQKQGGCCVFWYYWPSITTFNSPPYWVNVINEHDFKTGPPS